MKIFDISQEISEEMFVYKELEHKKPKIMLTRDYCEGSGGVRESKISMDLHTGTHIDGPMHMVEGGAGVDSIPLEHLITNCKVLDMTHVKDAIQAEDFETLNIEKGDMLIFKTRNSNIDAYDSEFIYLAESGATFLAHKRIIGVGTDALGIERSQKGHLTHHVLFEANIYVIEGLRLKGIEAGDYKLVALPLKIKDVDASPMRAILIKK